MTFGCYNNVKEIFFMKNNLFGTQLFRGIKEKDIQALLKCLGTREKKYKKGDIILAEGTCTEQLGIVLDGTVIVELGDIWGNNSVLSSIGPGGTFAEAYACVPGEPLMVNVIADENTSVLFISVANILSVCQNNCGFHNTMIRNLLTLCASKNLQLSQRVLHTGSKSIRIRLMSFFSEYIKKTGSYSFDIPYNRQQMADYLNVDRSALSNELAKMKKDGILRYSKNHFDILIHHKPV